MSFVVEHIAPSEEYGVFFEDNGEAACLYLARIDGGEILGLTDRLFVYSQIQPDITAYEEVWIAWTEDSARAALIVDGVCWAMMDVANSRKASAYVHGEIPFAFWETGMPATFGEALTTELPA